MKFTPDQQTEIDRLIQQRLVRQQNKHEAQMQTMERRHADEIARLQQPRGIIGRLRRLLYVH